MRIRLNLKPGQKGTKKLQKQYGDRLVCVRYRYDIRRKKRYKTVELIVEEVDWRPGKHRLPKDAVVFLRIGYPEVVLREQVKGAGAKWNPERRLWELRYDRVVELGLGERIVGESGI